MKTFSYYLDTYKEYGTVDQINHPVMTVKGLPTIKPRELVVLESGQKGWALSLDRDTVNILLLSQDKIPIGTKIARTNETLSIPVGQELLGLTINSLGDIITQNNKDIVLKEKRTIDTKPGGIKTRVKINKPFITGTSLVDMMIPLGKGQRELVIGDRKTGKSAFVMTTIKNQVLLGAIAIYAAIGKKKSDIKYLEESFEQEGIRDKIIIIASCSDDPSSAIFLTPYTAIAVAEYFRDKGEDSVVVLDDLSTHAKFYRELSLVGKNFPGRDSYPGDIFYTHSRLLERAGNFKHPIKKEVSITCLPVVQTVEGDVTGYIQTNLMGITDGHIFFDSEIFYNGRRPAVNISLSVTRAGRQTQTTLRRTINREVTSFLTLYEKMLNLSHFGNELTENVKSILAQGDRIFAFFNQPFFHIVEDEVQLILFGLVWLNIISEEKEINEVRLKLIEVRMNPTVMAIFADCISVSTLNDMLAKITKYKEEILSIWQTNVQSQKK